MSKNTITYRHRLWVRITHWLNVMCMTILLMSGLQIFNAHPALYWGDLSRFDAPLVAIGGEESATGQTAGVTIVAGHKFDTTGILGFSDGDLRAFPAWITLPSGQGLTMARRWHFFFAWIFVSNAAIYLIPTLLGRHLRGDLLPSRADMAHLGPSILEHMKLRFPRGDAARHYNALQKLTYLAVIFILGPVLVLAGLAMSPALDASYPILLDIFGGRQSARTVHFICAGLFLSFVIIHIAMVLLSGVWNNLRSMVTGWYDLGENHE